MYKIVIVTTEGCEACEIAQRNVGVAIVQARQEIEIEVKDWHSVDKDLIEAIICFN